MAQLLLLATITACATNPFNTTFGDGNYLVFPITTELQRKLVRPWTGGDAKNAKAYVLINGTGVVTNDGNVDDKALNLDALRNALAPYKEAKDGIVVVNLIHQLKRSAPLYNAMQAFGKDAGFREAKLVSTFMGEGFDWDQHIARINEKVSGADAEEGATGNDIVRVYPVRTILSRYLTLNADCVVEVLAPIESESDSIAARIRGAVVDQMPKAKVKNKGKILFLVSAKPAARKEVDHFVEQGSKELAELLGFQAASVSSGSASPAAK